MENGKDKHGFLLGTKSVSNTIGFRGHVFDILTEETITENR
jgi:hypothetical protein